MTVESSFHLQQRSSALEALVNVDSKNMRSAKIVVDIRICSCYADRHAGFQRSLFENLMHDVSLSWRAALLVRAEEEIDGRKRRAERSREWAHDLCR